VVELYQGCQAEKNTNEDGHEHAAPIASFPPNRYALYDMAGNVWEWTTIGTGMITISNSRPLAASPQTRRALPTALIRASLE
jgi:formylglycine-generating enzyme required for sulfatase activity